MVNEEEQNILPEQSMECESSTGLDDSNETKPANGSTMIWNQKNLEQTTAQLKFFPTILSK